MSVREALAMTEAAFEAYRLTRGEAELLALVASFDALRAAHADEVLARSLERRRQLARERVP